MLATISIGPLSISSVNGISCVSDRLFIQKTLQLCLVLLSAVMHSGHQE